MLNIMSNAIKFTPAGGTITLRIVQKQTAPEGSADYEFHIRDNGIGMSPAFQEHIFEQFAREETSTVSGIQAPASGMAITKNLIDMMDGGISVESEPGKGSEFTVSLRFPSAESVPPRPARIPQLEGLRALGRGRRHRHLPERQQDAALDRDGGGTGRPRGREAVVACARTRSEQGERLAACSSSTG